MPNIRSPKRIKWRTGDETDTNGDVTRCARPRAGALQTLRVRHRQTNCLRRSQDTGRQAVSEPSPIPAPLRTV